MLGRSHVRTDELLQDITVPSSVSDPMATAAKTWDMLVIAPKE